LVFNIYNEEPRKAEEEMQTKNDDEIVEKSETGEKVETKEESEKASEKSPTQEKNEPNDQAEDIPFVKIKMLEDQPEIVGIDFKDYGPFSAGEEYEMPEENAEIFISRKKAEAVSS